MKVFSTFKDAMDIAETDMRTKSVLVRRGKWQGLDVAKRPEMGAHELLHWSMKVSMPIENLDYYREQIKPNLPWADDHFAERVCGQPINPGVEWANWPWGKSADKFREDRGPEVSETDWAYLAALIDADGSITFPSERKPHIVIHQVDHDYLRSVQRRFRVGQLREQENRSGLSDRPYLRWQISAREDLKWVLGGVLRHIKLKREEAMQAFDMVPDGDLRLVDNRGREPRFNHNYMQRYWPKFAGMTDGGMVNRDTMWRDRLAPRRGIYEEYGDLSDVVKQLKKDPTTRQAILPVFFPEDTGGAAGGRVPCSIYYQFLLSGEKLDHLDIVYHLRSCDIIRHFRDDVYLTVRLLMWMLDQLRMNGEEDDGFWETILPGTYCMTIANFHCFRNDMVDLMRKVGVR